MGKKRVICDKCSREIKTKDDLVVATVILNVVPYCYRCYVDRIKGMSSVVVDNTPLNGTYSNVGVIIAAVIFVIMLFIEGSIKYPFLIGTGLFLIYRTIAFTLYYERHIEKG